MPKPIVFTAGYGQGNTAATLVERAEALNALVIDVRFAAWSERSEWQKPMLERVLKYRYFHLPMWGDRHHAEGAERIEIRDFEAGRQMLRRKIIRMAQSELRPIRFHAWILLCGCRDVGTCHRGHLGKVLREEYGFTVKPLVWRPDRGKETEQEMTELVLA